MDFGRWALVVGVLVYAALAGCYTLKNFDLGWQLATGRYIAETGHIPRHDVFSYTAAGKEWIYPAGGQLLFYLLYKLGGYAALNVLGMLVCAGTVALLLVANRDNLGPGTRDLGLRLWLAALAVPAIADRTGARADMFTTLLFAAVLVILWRFRSQAGDWRLEPGGQTPPGLQPTAYSLRPLLLLPFLFLIWANLHQGFIFGLAVLLLFCVAEIAARPREWDRIRRLLLLSGLSAIAVLANPWGWRLYASLWRVRQDMAFQRGFIGEASGVPWGWWRLKELVRLDDPDAGFWLLLAAALAGMAVALVRRQFLPALLLAGAVLLGLQYVRAQALAVITIAVVLPGLWRPKFDADKRRSTQISGSDLRSSAFIRVPFLVLLAVVLVVRCSGLVSNRYYVARADIATFGAGVSWWFPERALDFIERERLPGRLYHDYNLGGWVMWRLWPRYQVFVDGRAEPFSPHIILEQHALRAAAPGSPEWRSFLDRLQINTILVSLARYGGYRLAPAELCASPEFRLVYMDEVSGVWLRDRPENRAWIDRLAQPCLPAPFPVAGNSPVERYNFLANAGQLYHAFQRDADALGAYREAERIFPEDGNLRFSIAQVWDSRGRTAEARLEYGNALALRESSSAWHSLGLLETREGHHSQAAAAFACAGARAVLPHESYRMLGESYLALKEPRRALAAFEKARAASRYRGQSAWLGLQWLAMVEDGEQRARAMLRSDK